MTAVPNLPPFRPIPAALCNRIRAQVAALQAARTVDDQIRALFLCWALLKDAEGMMPPVTATEEKPK